MEMFPKHSETITIEGKVKQKELYPVLDQLSSIFCSIKRKLFVDLYHRRRPLNEVKVECCAFNNISARHFNSIHSDVKSQVNSQIELQKTKKASIERKVKSLDKYIKHAYVEVAKAQANIHKIEKHKKAVLRYKKVGDIKKPYLALNLRNVTLSSLRKKIKTKKFQIHQKTRKRDNYLLQYHALIKNEGSPPPICFGSKKFFKQQHYLEENGFKTHQEWLDSWHKVRNYSTYWIGSCDETLRNQNAQYDPDKKVLKLRLPSFMDQTHLNIPLEFPYKSEDLTHALTQNYYRFDPKQNKWVHRPTPVSYRILKRENEYYVQAIFERPHIPVTTIAGTGAIGIDFNMNHLAVTETDRFGNPIWRASHYFNVDEKNSGKNMAQLSNFLSMIVNRACKSKKMLVIEDLDFSNKKMTIKEKHTPSFRKAFSSMAYSRYQLLVKSKCHQFGVKLKIVNPAYTSLIGLYKFNGYKKYTSHELAALCIARRGLRMSERLKSKVTFGESVRILDLEKVSSTKIKHVWSYWRRLSKEIRELACCQTHRRTESINPFYPPWVLSDVEHFSRNLCSGKDSETYFRRFQLKYYQWIRGKYCCFPVVKGHPLIRKSIQRFG